MDYYTFNHGDKKEDMLAYIQKKDYPFQPYWLDQKNIDKLDVIGFPTFIAIEKNGRVALRTLDVTELEKFIKAYQ